MGRAAERYSADRADGRSRHPVPPVHHLADQVLYRTRHERKNRVVMASA
jgi:hypothetical protein